MMLWTDPAGTWVPAGDGTRDGSHISTTYLSGNAYSEIRRFVVIAEGHGSVICSYVFLQSTSNRKANSQPGRFIHTRDGLPSNQIFLTLNNMPSYIPVTGHHSKNGIRRRMELQLLRILRRTLSESGASKMARKAI